MEAMRSRRGFTLLEVMVAIGVFVIVTAAAFVFAKSQITMRKQTQQLLDTEQNARVALDSIRFDLQASGLGVGYTLNGVFSGMTMGPFGPFQSNEHLHPNGFSSDDLRIRGATGPVRTISEYFAPNANGTMQVCAGGGFKNGDLVLIVSESYADARAVTLNADAAPATCGEGFCEVGCETLSFRDESATFATDPSAADASYLGGSAFRGFIDVTYFIEWNGEVPGLFRAEGPCATRATCATQANLLGEGVSSLQVRVWELDPDVAAPRDVTTDTNYNDPTLGGGVKSTNRVRVDVEVIAQSRTQETADAPPSRECSAINTGLCFPRLGGGPDRFRRRKLMTSVELKNSGHMRFQALR